MKKHWQKTVSALALAVLATAGLTSQDVRAAGDSVDLKFTYTVLQGTCDVSVGSDGVNGTLKFDPISTSNITKQTWDPLNTSAKLGFKVILSNCSGTPDSKTRPALTLFGNTEQLTGDSTNKNYMFVEPTSTAKGVGFAIYKNNTSKKSTDLVAEIRSSAGDNRKYIDVTKTTNTVATDGTIDLNAIVTCGSTCVTGLSNMRAGDLSASVTFNFVYY